MSDWRREVKKDSPFLYHFDIEGKSPVEVEIVGFETIEAFCPGKGTKGGLWSLEFKGAKKKLGINVTNGNLIEHVVGTADKDKWVGKKIVLRVADCAGDKCIRVHAPGAKLPKQCKRFKYLDADPSTKTGSGKAAQSAIPVADSGGSSSPAEPEPALKIITDVLAKDEVTKADVDKVGMMTGTDGTDNVQALVKDGQFRAAVELMAEMERE